MSLYELSLTLGRLDANVSALMDQQKLLVATLEGMGKTHEAEYAAFAVLQERVDAMDPKVKALAALKERGRACWWLSASSLPPSGSSRRWPFSISRAVNKHNQREQQMNDIDMLARTIWGEARGEGASGMTAVAAVVMNRTAIAKAYLYAHNHPHPLFGDGSAASCCQAKYQFSCWLEADPNRAKLLAVSDADPAFRTAIDTATKAMAGDILDPTNGATHYYERHMPRPPAWAEGKTPCASIGNHIFFKGV